MGIVTSTAKRKTKQFNNNSVIVIIINYINYMDKSIGTYLNQTHFQIYIKSSMQSTFTNKLFKKKRGVGVVLKSSIYI